MGYLIDTNILSELRKGERANPGVKQWFASIDQKDIFLSVLVLGEIRQGIERIRRRDPASASNLEQWLEKVRQSAGEKILVVNSEITDTWGRLGIPEPLPVIDALMAATAIVHGLTLVTRNVRDVEKTEALIHNPFT